MIQTITRKNTLYYQVSLVVLMLTLVSVIFYFWRMGFLDGSKSKDLHTVNFILEGIDKKKPIKDIRRLVVNENNKIALSRLDSLEKDLKQIDAIISDSEFSQVYDEHQQVKSNIASLVSFTKTDKVIEIFNTKLRRFNEFVQNNDWRTLTRSSNRILSLTKGHINKTRLMGLTKRVGTEIDLMEKVTRESVLVSSEKSEILSRIAQFRIELKMLKRYSVNKRNFLGMIKGYQRTLGAWIKKISPEVSVQKLKLEHAGKYFIMSLFGILAMSLLLFAGGFVYLRKRTERDSLAFESFVQDYVSENLIKGKMLNLSNVSESFMDYSRDTQSYIEKRMSFGQVFQKALPFSSILLDNNLKVVWANDQFCENWKLDPEEVSASRVSWDYLANFINLGEDDPVIEAIRSQVGGIFQIKLQLNEDSKAIPFEMYVSPVKLNNEMKVMAFFYPLDSLEETINDQAMSIINPVSRTLKLMEQNSLSQVELEKLEKDFKLAQISSLYKSFVSFQLENESQKNRLFDEIELLNSKLNEYSETMDEVQTKSNATAESFEGIRSSLKSFKTNIIEVLGSFSEVSDKNEKQQKMLDEVLTKLNSSLEQYSNLKDKSELSLSTLKRLLSYKSSLKEKRGDLDQGKARLSHSISAMVHIKNKISDLSLREKFEGSYEKMNQEFESFKLDLVGIEKEISSLEILMSKNEMLIHSFAMDLNTETTDNELQNVADYRTQMIELHMNNSIEDNEEQIVGALKDAFNYTQGSKKTMSELSHLMSEVEPYKGFMSSGTDVGQA